MTGRAPRPILAILLAVWSLTVAACGIPPSDEVESLDAAEYQELLQGASTTVEAATVDPLDNEPELRRLFWFGPDLSLEAVSRTFGPDPLITDVLNALGNGVNETDQRQIGEEFGPLTSKIPPDLGLTLLENDDPTSHRINVNPEADLRSLSASEPVRFRQIVIQIVCTVMGVSKDNIVGVQIYDDTQADAEPIPLIDADGQTIVGPANQSDFGDCRTGADDRAEATEALEDGGDTDG